MRFFLIAAIPLAFLLYGHALDAPLYLDDANVLEIASSPRLGTRSLGYFSFFISSVFADLFAPFFHWKPFFYYRLGNLLVHVLTATAVLGLARELTGKYQVGVVAGFLFLVHPVVSQPVMYITQRFESLAALLMVASAAAYTRFRNIGNKSWLAAAVGFGALAALSKETAVVLPLWILVLELTFFKGWRWDRRYLYLIPVLAVLSVPGWQAFRGSATTLTSVPWGQYLISQGGVLLKYLQLSLYPVEQFLSYDVGVVSDFSLRVLGEWVAVLAILTTGIVLIRRYPIVGFGIVTFFVLLLPVILLPLPDLIFEHRVYPAFMGLAVAAGGLFQGQVRRSVALILVVVLIVYAARTFQRSAEWNDDVAFYEAHRVRFPDDPNTLAALAVKYFIRGEVNLAQQTLEEARRHEDHFNAYYSTIGRINIAANLLTVWMTKRDYVRAKQEVDRALSLDPTEPTVRRIEGSFYSATGEHEKALAAFEELTRLDPVSVIGWIGVRNAHTRLGNAKGAEDASAKIAGITEQESALGQSRWRVPARYRTQVIFVLLVLVIGGVVLVGRWAWIDARQRWSNG